MVALARPQPLGIFPLPAGYLAVAADPACDAARAELLAGRRPAAMPPALEYYEKALQGDIAGALRLLDGADPLSELNRFVLDPAAGRLDSLRAAPDPAVALCAELVAFSVGLAERPPGTGAATGEIRALVLAAHAAAALEQRDPARAAALLAEAAEAAGPVSPVLAAQLAAAAALRRGEAGGAALAVAADLDAALACLEGTDLAETRAEIHLNAGMALQDGAAGARQRLVAAVRHYQAALAIVDEEEAPEIFAAAHVQLALCYLTMPMTEASDQLRIATAVQSLRHALRVYEPATHRDEWASAQMNLANALVYLPSAHQGDNLVEAVELYEQVLQVRDRLHDPLGYARVCANQGNALAHLGVFDHAQAKLHEARAIFEEFEDHEAVRSVREVLDEIARQRVTAGGG